MKTHIAQPSTFKCYPRLLPALVLSLSILVTLSACQKEPEPEAIVATPVDVQTTEVNSENKATAVAVIEDTSVEADREINLTEIENNVGAAAVTADTETTAASPEQNIKGTQVTDVKYQSATGASMSVIFETSATGVLNAIVTLPNKPKMTLSAPEGQGNNPTYRSTDGSIELISHGGGSTIDLMQNNKVTSYEATSAEAEVVTQP